jgi:tRNA A-37 threonylcarbamoyl transferase component Bud32/TolB-like protein
MSTPPRDQLRDTLQVGLGSSYVVERELGGGGMSRVFVATEAALERRVVIKLLPPELAHAVSADRFRQEIRLAARLQHAHIVPVLSAGQAAGLLYYTMPMVEGESLRARLERSGELAVREAVRVLRDVAAALDYAHEQGVVHRDIKPDNVLLARGEAVVTDFGVAKAISASAATAETALTSIGVALGTPAYMAPEQAAADPHVDHRADIYAFGCLAYECLSGLPPFTGRTIAAVLAAHLSEAPEPLDRRRAGLPPALAAVVMRCLEKRPADRPQRASEILAGLEDLAATPSGGTAPTVRVRPPRTRRAVVPVVAAVAAAALLAAGAVLKARSGPRVAPSAAVMAVMPFTPAAPDTALSRLGRDLAVTLSANLDGVGEIRTVDALTMLAQVKATGASPSLREAADLSRRLGAKSVLQGTLVGVGETIRADIGLFTTDSTKSVARVTVSGPRHDVSALTDSITWAVLRQVWRTRGAPTPSITALTTHSVPALRSFLEGERAITEGRFARAEEAFGRALEADSSFWLAYRRYEFARSWRFKPVDSVIFARYRANRQALPERERLLIEALMPDSLGDRDVRLLKLTQRFPDFWPAAWEYADENLTHRGGLLGHTRREAQAALERTIALNPDLTGAWDHLLWMGIHNRDSGATRRALAANARVHIDSLWREEGSNFFTSLRLAAYQFLAPDSAAMLTDSMVRAITAEHPEDEGGNLLWFGFPRAQIGFSRRALKRPLRPEDASHHSGAIAVSWAARGAWDSALVALDSIVSRKGTLRSQVFRYQFAVVAAWLGAVPAAEASRRRPAGIRDSVESAAELAWLDGILAVARRDRPALARARDSLRASGGKAISDLERSLAGFDTHLRGDNARAATELARLERERAQLLRDEDEHPLVGGIDRLAASRWLAAAGDTAQAVNLLRWNETVLAPHYGWMTVNLALAGPALLEEARLQDGQQRAEDARRAYARFLEWYDAPMASQRHLVEEARKALDRLSGVREIPPEPADKGS